MAHIISDYMTAQEVAAILRVSPETVIRKFEGVKGVVDIGSPEGRFKRRYRVMRIPREALEQFIIDHRV